MFLFENYKEIFKINLKMKCLEYIYILFIDYDL
jgi:hypothetical protein